MKLTVHVVTSGRQDLLEKCCRSIVKALIPGVEVNVLINGDHPAAEAWLKELNHPAFSWLSVPREPLTEARNRPLATSRADHILYLDDDVEVAPHLFATVIRYLDNHPDIAIIGGPNLTPPDSPRVEHAFGAVMTSFFAAPMVRARYGGRARKESVPTTGRELMFCNLAVRRASIPPDIRFRKGLKSNEENLFIYECSRAGLKSKFIPSAYVYHHRRPSLRLFTRQIFSYGFGRAQQTRLTPGSLHPAFLVPPLAWVGLIVALFSPVLRPWIPVVMAAHLVVSVLASLESPTVRALGVSGVLSMGPLTMLVHAAYGLGFWKGLFNPVRPPAAT